MPDLYGAHHVLLAPSIWPESYGLVAREAATAGLWVVASNLGAMGEDITPGRDGFVIDVASPEALSAVFREISANRSRYMTPPERSAGKAGVSQSAALIEIYQTITGSR